MATATKASVASKIEDILDQPMGDWEAPKPLPAGHYTFVIDGQPRFDKSARKGTPFIELMNKPLSAHDDVDEDDLNEVGDLSKKRVRLTFYFTEESKYRFQDFARDVLGLEVEDKAPRQIASEMPGCQFVGTITHTSSEDGQRKYAEISDYTAVE